MDKRFFVELTEWARIRVHLSLVKGRVRDLVIQLEVWRGEWIPVVRYDTAHGVPHRDFLRRRGPPEKTWLGHSPLSGFVNVALDDLREHWRQYLYEAGYQEEEFEA